MTINSQQILIFLTTVILMIALQVIVKYTKMGKAMRAVSTDPEAAQLMGINVDNVISFTFVLGSSLAGAAGVLVGIYYNSISPLMGVTPGLKAFVAAVFGGIGIIPGAMVGGYVIGDHRDFGQRLWRIDVQRCGCVPDPDHHPDR